MTRAILLQQTNTGPNSYLLFSDMLRLTTLRHAAYCRAKRMDYLSLYGDVPGANIDVKGAWSKIYLVKWAIDLGYKDIIWLDTDAAIVDFNADIREALPGEGIGACVHDPETSKFLRERGVAKHMNVGVMYFRTNELVKQFVNEWIDSYPGDPQWLEQGSFNKLITDERYKDIIHTLDDKWNSTLNVNQSKTPVVKAWHGLAPVEKRFVLMKTEFQEDHIKFKV